MRWSAAVPQSVCLCHIMFENSAHTCQLVLLDGCGFPIGIRGMRELSGCQRWAARCDLGSQGRVVALLKCMHDESAGLVRGLWRCFGACSVQQAVVWGWMPSLNHTKDVRSMKVARAGLAYDHITCKTRVRCWRRGVLPLNHSKDRSTRVAKWWCAAESHTRHECGARGRWVAALKCVPWGEEQTEHVVPHGLEHLCGGRPSRRVSKLPADGQLVSASGQIVVSTRPDRVSKCPDRVVSRRPARVSKWPDRGQQTARLWLG